jgi:hypothetical protein
MEAFFGNVTFALIRKELSTGPDRAVRRGFFGSGPVPGNVRRRETEDLFRTEKGGTEQWVLD